MARYAHWVPKNNHAVVIGAGIGTAALALDHPDAQRWMDTGLSLIKAGLHNIEPDGSYREGAYYARFILSELVPFAHYTRQVTRINLLSHQKIRRLIRWLIALEKPDGRVPLFDDAFPEELLYAPIAVSLADDPEMINTSFINQKSRFRQNDPNWVEAFCAYPV